MKSVFATLENLGFLNLLWLFVFAFIVHELEEWNITDFEHRSFVGAPSTATTKNARIWIAFICTVGLIWCAAATLPGNPTVAAFVFLPAVALAAGNALQHIFWSLYFRQYAPGVITAVLLLIPLGGYLTITAIHQDYVPLWYVAIWLGVIALVMMQTVRSGNQASPMIHGIYNLGNWIAEKLSI